MSDSLFPDCYGSSNIELTRGINVKMAYRHLRSTRDLNGIKKWAENQLQTELWERDEDWADNAKALITLIYEMEKTIEERRLFQPARSAPSLSCNRWRWSSVAIAANGNVEVF